MAAVKEKENNGCVTLILPPRSRVLNKWKENGETIFMAPKKLFFDIDDVLFPSTEFSALARKNALNAMIEHGLNIEYEMLEHNLEKVIKKYGSNYSRHFDVLVKELGVEKNKKAKFVAAATGAYANTKAAIGAYADVPLALLELREKYPLYVASDGLAVKQWDKLIRIKLAMFFDDVFVSQELGVQKSPRFYRKIAGMVNAKPETCVMIGDRESKDVVPAKEAGWTTIKVRRQGAKYSEGETVADGEISSFVKLDETLERI